MNASYAAYRLLTACSSVVLVPLIWLHHRFRGDNFHRFYQRMGHYPACLAKSLPGRRRIWIHAVSVGEMGVAAAIAKTLVQKNPECTIVLSTIREQGLARAAELMGATVPCVFAPLDLVGPTRKALECIKPDILVLLETEIWPNWIVGARRRGTRIAIANGRISARSIRRYRKVRSLMGYTLSHVDAFSMISRDDAQRIHSLGAPGDRLHVNGNAKFDSPDPLGDHALAGWAKQIYGITAGTKVFVAGSTRNPEEQVILDAFLTIRSRHPDTVLIIAPRHIERAAQVGQWVADRGLRYQLRTALDSTARPRTAPVVILDTMGELSATYSVANMVFCGGSLVPKGGQNILEPAMWGKPVLYGPSMEDFADARQVIQASGGGVMVASGDQLAAKVLQWLEFPLQAAIAGRAARQAILPHRGAAEKHAAVISSLLPAVQSPAILGE
jgi:3-deoxy-D-manno-octulosonic-acid transferase